MKPLKVMAQEYLSLRRSLGFKMIDTEYVLRWFLTFMQSEHETHIKTETLLRWVHASESVSLPVRSARFAVVRKFAQYVHALDSEHEVPPYRLLMHRTERTNPHIYSDSEVLRLLEACLKLRPGKGLCRYTYYTIFGLLAVTGMRISEATSLIRDDVDFSAGIVTIRETKFSKMRCIPVHSSTIEILAEYARRRDAIYPNAESSAFFLSDTGAALTSAVVRVMFLCLSRRIGFRKPTDRNGPRIHDMRHSFAVKTVMQWYRNGADVEQYMPLLSTYLGHVKPSDTYWYLSSVPELVGLAAARLEAYQGGLR
jgi:integrase/recombinase XerD